MENKTLWFLVGVNYQFIGLNVVAVSLMYPLIEQKELFLFMCA
jgi:hypothetical protein